MLKAIYIPDLGHADMPVFTLNEVTGMFEMDADKNFQYSQDIIKNDPNWLVFEQTLSYERFDKELL